MTYPLAKQSLERLAHPPLRLAVVQVVTTPMLDLEQPDKVQQVLSALDDWVLVDRQSASEGQFVVGPQGITQQDARQHTVWVLSTADDTVRASLTQHSVAVESTAYDTWRTMSGALASILDAVEQRVRPPRCTRLGVRYINELPANPTSRASDLTDLVRDTLLAQAAAFDLPIRSSLSELRLIDTEEGDQSLVVRHGLQPGGGYLLDFDAFIERQQAFDASVLVAQAEELHDRIESVFCWSLAPQALDRLKAGEALR